MGSHLDEISSGVLSPSAESLFSDHVVGGQILHPGVGYLESTFVANLGRHSVFTSVAFMRPCWLPQPGGNERCVLRCTRQGEGAFEIASWRGAGSSLEHEFKTHFRANLESSTYCAGPTKMSISRYVSCLLTEQMDGQSLSAKQGMNAANSHRKINAMRLTIRSNSTAITWRDSRTAGIFNASKSLCSADRRCALDRSTVLARVTSDKSKCVESHPVQTQTLKSLHCTILSRLCIFRSYARANK